MQLSRTLRIIVRIPATIFALLLKRKQRLGFKQRISDLRCITMASKTHTIPISGV